MLIYYDDGINDDDDACMHACCILADVDDAGMTSRRIRQICMQHAIGAAHTYAARNENEKKKKKRRRKKKIKLSSYFSRSVYCYTSSLMCSLICLCFHCIHYHYKHQPACLLSIYTVIAYYNRLLQSLFIIAAASRWPFLHGKPCLQETRLRLPCLSTNPTWH